jgi:Resolvase, N terminal domain
MTKRIGLYLRVSTKNGQTVNNQREALTEAIGRRSGWIIADEFADKGITGAKGRDKRPEFDRLLKEVVRGKIDVVAAWSVDRLGRSLQDLVGFLGACSHTHSAKVRVFPKPRATRSFDQNVARFGSGGSDERNPAGLPKCRAANDAVMVDQRERFVRNDFFELIFGRAGTRDVRRRVRSHVSCSRLVSWFTRRDRAN